MSSLPEYNAGREDITYKESMTGLTVFIGLTPNPSGQYAPVLLHSYADFLILFGEQPLFSLDIKNLLNQKGQKTLQTKVNLDPYLLHQSVKLFFRTGGTTCYALAINPSDSPTVSLPAFVDALRLLDDYPEISIISVPDALLLPQKEYYQFCRMLLKYCEDTASKKMAILDIYDGFKEWEKRYIDTRYGIKETENTPDIINNFREGIGWRYLKRGMSFFPWLHTNTFQLEDVQYFNTNRLTDDLPVNVKEILLQEPQGPYAIRNWHQELATLIPGYQEVILAALFKVNQLPPGPAIAALLYQSDKKRGFWKSPANTAIKSAADLTCKMSREQVVDLQLPLGGKSINPLRPFINLGAYLAKAKTLAGNSHEWRYICHARTIFFIQDMLSNILKEYQKDTNAPQDEERLIAETEEFLKWMHKKGALKGKTTEEAYRISMLARTKQHRIRMIVEVAVIVVGVFTRLEFLLPAKVR